MSGQPVKVAVAKETPDTKVGVTFRQDSDADIIIHTIASDSMFANTRLQPGMEVLRVNGVSVDCLSLASVMKMMREAEDVVTIEACAIDKGGITKQHPVASAPPTVSARRPDPEPMQNDDVEAQWLGNNEEDEIPVAAALVVDSSRFDPHAAGAPVITMNATQVVDTAIDTGVKADFVNGDGSVTVTASKRTQDSPAGVGMVYRSGVGVVITSIKTFSIFTGTSLRKDMKILQVNGSDVSQESAEHVATLLRSIVGEVTVVATNIYNDPEAHAGNTAVASVDVPLTTAVVTKPTQEAKVGLGVTDRFTPWGTTVPVISSIAPDGPCARSSLQVGMRVLSINGIGCRGRDDTIAMLRMAPAGVMTIVAGPPRMLMANVTKATRDTKVGLAMQRQSGRLMITGLPSTGLFHKTDLKAGMHILQINGVDVGAMEAGQVLGLIASAEGNVSVVAEHVATAATVRTNGGAGGAAGAAASDLSAPPPGVPAGGAWGVGNYFGPINGMWYCVVCVFCGICGLFTLCCKADRAAMYRAPSGQVFDVRGKLMGSEAETQFHHNPPGVHGPQQLPISDVERNCGPDAGSKLVAIGTCISVGISILYVVLVVAGGQSCDCTYYSTYYDRYECC